MGFGIWSMHYIGMLAFKIHMAVAYDRPTVLPSLLVAILASGVALYLVSSKKMGMGLALVGSLVTGVGIAGMHYMGTHAIDDGSASIGFHFDPSPPQYFGPEYAVIECMESSIPTVLGRQAKPVLELS
jgi:NO-binding membrane sensor protein with MHYT domain